MLLNDSVIKTATVGNKKGYFATFFIPPANDDECVFQDIVKTDKTWRPDTSLSHDTNTSSSGDVHAQTRTSSFHVKNRPRHDATTGQERHPHEKDFNADGERVTTARSLKATSSMSGYPDMATTPPPSRSAPVHRSVTNSPDQVQLTQRRKPIKYAFDHGKAFATPKERMTMTRELIDETTRDRNAPERTCRSYSSYTIFQKRDNIAISPNGEPNLKGAAGRYREQYKSMTNTRTEQPDVHKETRDYVFNRFFENLTLRASLSCRSPIGKLKRPPPMQVHKVNKNTSPITVHEQARSRLSTVHKDLGSAPRDVSPGAVCPGVEYVIAMEMSQNLEKHRKKRTYNSPSTPTVALTTTSVIPLDAPRLRAQSGKYLTPGETSIKTNIDANLFDEKRLKRGPIKCIERKARVRSPPLSKMSRDRFLPEAIRRREMLKQENLVGLRIAGANTPVTDLKTETTRRPRSMMTSTTKLLQESIASKSETSEDLRICDLDEDISDMTDKDRDDLEAELVAACQELDDEIRNEELVNNEDSDASDDYSHLQKEIEDEKDDVFVKNENDDADVNDREESYMNEADNGNDVKDGNDVQDDNELNHDDNYDVADIDHNVYDNDKSDVNHSIKDNDVDNKEENINENSNEKSNTD